MNDWINVTDGLPENDNVVLLFTEEIEMSGVNDKEVYKMGMDKYIEKFVQERNEALFSLDEEKIMRYCLKYGVPIPTDEKVFWGMVYKAIYNITDAPQSIKNTAQKWLLAHGMSTTIS